MADSKTLQLPLLPDPGKHDDILLPTEKLDFAVRLGTSLARGHATDERTVRKELSIKLQQEHPSSKEPSLSQSRRSSPVQSPRKAECDFLSPTSSRRPTPSPRNFNGNKVFQFPPGFHGNKPSNRRGSKQNQRQFSQQEIQELHKLSRKQSRDGRQFASKESRRESRKESRTNLIRQTTMLHTYITDRETVCLCPTVTHCDEWTLPSSLVGRVHFYLHGKQE